MSNGTKVSRGTAALGSGVLCLLALLAAAPAAAQVSSKKSETQIQNYNLAPETARESVFEEAKKGPADTKRMLAQKIAIEEIERTETALSRLRNLVTSTPVKDIARADYLFRLAELFYDRARYYEQRNYDRRDQAFELERKDPARSAAYRQAAADDMRHSVEFADQAIKLYSELYANYRDTYSKIDAVLFYLGANLLQTDEPEAAKEVFEALALNFPKSEYLAQAYFMVGELAFGEGDMRTARASYERAAQFPEKSIYPFALYKVAWCAFNLADTAKEKKDSVGLLYESILAATERVAKQGDSMRRLRDDGLRDMTLFWATAYKYNDAVKFFTKVTAETEVGEAERTKLVARLARIYGERADYADSTALFRQLMELTPNDFAIVGYQREIVRNTRPGGSRAAIVASLNDLTDTLSRAMTFPDTNAGDLAKSREEVELLLRQFSTTYHSDAQTTNNEELYSLAGSLYEKYLALFGEEPGSYDIWFYAGELKYRLKRWSEAAVAYEKALTLSAGATGGAKGRYDQEATYASCLAQTNLVDMKGSVQAQASNSNSPTGELPPVPTPREISKDFSNMLSACERYLNTGPEVSAETAEIEYAVAYTLYDYDHLEAAIPKFGRLALDLYAAEPGRAQVSAELLLDSLALQRRFPEMKEWIGRLATAPVGQGKLAPKLRELGEQVNFKECRDLQQAKKFEDSGLCFVDFAQNHFESKLLDKALFNAAVSYEKIYKLDFSISLYEQIIEFRPDSELVPDTTFGLAQTYHRIAMYDKAADLYEQYARNNPKGEQVVNASANAYQFRQGLGQYDKAIANLKAFIKVSDRDKPKQREGIAEANYQIAMIQVEQGKKVEAIATLERFIREDGAVSPSRAIEARVKLGELSTPAKALAAYGEALLAVERLEPSVRETLTPAALDAASKAQFLLAEQIFKRYEAIEMKGNEEQVKTALRQKADVGTQARQEFDKVRLFKRPGWMIASSTRTGQMYMDFYKRVIDTPIPEGLPPLVEEEYRSVLEGQASELKQQAKQWFAGAIEVARRTGWFNDYSEQAAKLLQELDPTFKSLAELRVSPGYDSVGFYAPGYVDPSEQKKAGVLGGDGTGADAAPSATPAASPASTEAAPAAPEAAPAATPSEGGQP